MMSDNSEATSLRWVSWAAVSTQPQAAVDKVSIPEQLRLNTEHIGKHGGSLVAELTVPGESRSIDTWEEACQRIDAYAQLRDLIDRKAFDVLAYYDASRLARTLSLGATIRQLCDRRDIILYQTTAPPAELRAGWRHDQALVAAIQSVGAQEEVAKLVERRRIGMIGRMKRGEFPQKPNFGYGYRYSPDGQREIIVVEAAASAVRFIFSTYLEGRGFVVIARDLQADGHASPSGRPWTSIMVNEIVDRVWVYAGTGSLNRWSRKGAPIVQAPGRWQPLIDEATARLVEEERRQRRANRRLPEAVLRYSGVCVCAACGGSMHYRRVLPGDQKYVDHEIAYIRCIRHRPTLSVVEPKVTAHLRGEILALQGLDLEGFDNLADDPLAPLRAKAAENEGARERLLAQLRRADDAFVTGLMDDERYRTQVERIKAQLGESELQRARLAEQMAQEVELGTRRQRLEDARSYGLHWLETDDVAAANVWLRRHVRVICEARKVAVVEWL